MTQIKYGSLKIAPGLDLFHTGPSLDSGEMNALFYFSLSGLDSLCVNPFNQIVQFLSDRPIRIFSLNLPAHEDGRPPEQAIDIWAKEMSQGLDPFSRFLDEAQQAVEYVVRQRLVAQDKVSVAGLSRGALLAALLAAREERIKTVLGFAPLTRLNIAEEFQSIKHLPLVELYDISHYARALAVKNIRFYIGNRDTRVKTRSCFECIEKIVEAAHEQKIRPSQVELIIYPSVGKMGHGTPPEIFRQGAEWISHEK